MDLARHAAVLWRFRVVTAVGIGVAVLLAILASYQPGLSGFTARGAEKWTANSRILVTQPGFPEGRVTLPQQQIDQGLTAGGDPAVPPMSTPKDQVEFADPARLGSLADLYSKFLTSDEVLNRVAGRPTSGLVEASPFQSSSGGLILPVIQLTTISGTSEGAKKLNKLVFNSLRGVLEENQKANQISRAKRVEVQVIDAPEAVLTAGRKHTASILALFLGLLGTLAVTHLLAALRDRKGTEDMLASIELWGDGEPGDLPDDLPGDLPQRPYVAGEREAGQRLDW